MVNLKEERLKKGYTQEELGDKVGLVRQAISAIELGVRRPSVETAQAIGKVLDIDWTRFFPSK